MGLGLHVSQHFPQSEIGGIHHFAKTTSPLVEHFFIVLSLLQLLQNLGRIFGAVVVYLFDFLRRQTQK